MMEFQSQSDCTLCPLHATCKTVCISSVPYRVGHGGTPKTRALLFLGEAPGYDEDNLGEPFVGASGSLLKKAYIDFWKFWEVADIYLGNSVRCRPPSNDTPTAGQIKKCRPYLLDDLSRLQEAYEEVIIVCCGATAAKALGSKSLKAALGRQLVYPQLLEEK